MGGDVGVRSAPGVGSTFWMTARLATRARAASTTPQPAPLAPEDRIATRHAGTRVLLVDDDPVNQEVALALLRRLRPRRRRGERWRRRRSSRCAQHDYALVLMDVQMPVMDGLRGHARHPRPARPAARCPSSR